MLDGALLETWRECEDTLKAWLEVTEKPVRGELLSACKGDEKRARAVQVNACAVIFRGQLQVADEWLRELRPETLTLAHRQVRAMIIAYLDGKNDPQVGDDPEALEGPAMQFARRALGFTRRMREVMQAGAKKRGKHKDEVFIRDRPEPQKSETAPLDKVEEKATIPMLPDSSVGATASAPKKVRKPKKVQ